MNGGGHQLLAGARLAGDEDAGVARRHLGHQFAHTAERRPRAHHLVAMTERGVQRAVGGLCAGKVEGGLEGHEHRLGGERLFEKLEGAEPGGADGVGQLGLAAHHDDRARTPPLPERLQRGEPVGSRRHHQVEENRVGLGLIHRQDGGVPVRGLRHHVSLGAQQRPEHPADVRFVVDEENGGHQ